jgi:hypothetical protein
MVNQGSDVLVVGGGCHWPGDRAGAAAAGRHRYRAEPRFAQAASHAAAGMLAPQAEGMAPGPMGELCLASLSLYPSWLASSKR